MSALSLISLKTVESDQKKFPASFCLLNLKSLNKEVHCGMQRSALEKLSSEKTSEDRIPHICNILRFVVLKKGHAFMAIGRPCVSADGSNPTGDEVSLIQTAIRYAKDVVNLDLQKCLLWNRFLEIHYDRVGKDGLFSHKEVTVLFVPDLSECHPSLDTWRAQCLAHRKVVSEREPAVFEKREIEGEERRIKRIVAFRDKVVDKWQRKTEVTIGVVAIKKKLQAFNQNISEQVAAYLRDPSRMIKQMQHRRSIFGAFGTVT